MELIVDNRESIRDEIKKKLDIVKFENLDIGDYMYKLDGRPFLVIERKTVCDYAASIRDGRNKEQKTRLIELSKNCNVIYLVEGNLSVINSSFQYNKINCDTIISSIINTMLRDKLNVFHSSGKEETIFILLSIFDKLKKQKDTFLDSNNNISLENSYLKKKSDNMNPNIGFQMMLNCIPKVSSVVSKRLASKYSTIYNFIENINKLQEHERINFIQNIKTSEKKNGRKISKTAATNIIEYLCI